RNTAFKVAIKTARTLTPQEVIGKPERDDFPLLKGKEVMLQADFKGSLGQAFTDMPGNYSGSLREILATGTSAANNTLTSLLIEKPIIFYGVTIAGVAYLKGYEQYCFCGH
ncbi:unnamed protein product, partial [marine sediment metagenome]